MDQAFDASPSSNPALRYIAILSAARDFGVSRADRERIARMFDPFSTQPDELAGALVDALMRATAAD